MRLELPAIQTNIRTNSGKNRSVISAYKGIPMRTENGEQIQIFFIAVFTPGGLKRTQKKNSAVEKKVHYSNTLPSGIRIYKKARTAMKTLEYSRSSQAVFRNAFTPN